MVLHCIPEKGLPLDLPNGVVARCIGGPRDWEGLSDEADANAMLMTAAPALYEKLQRLQNEFEALIQEKGGELSLDMIYRFRTWIDEIDFWLAEARGELEKA